MSRSIVYVKFPKVGIGNLLLIWARAKVFAEINHFEVITSSWWGIRWGTILRKENKKRFYFGYFKESTLLQRYRVLFFQFFKAKYYEPAFDSYSHFPTSIFIFNEVAVSPDLFKFLREHRNFIHEEIYKLINPSVLKSLDTYSIPSISIHIRRGDFKYGNPITPLSFFINSINLIRENYEEELPVTIFTDASAMEISEIFSIPNVCMAEKKPDILDILLMSKSKVVVLSQSSTFSYWAAFLSDAIIIKPANDWQNNLRDEDSNGKYFEGKINFEENIGISELATFLANKKLKA